jgi:hypothetical protein
MRKIRFLIPLFTLLVSCSTNRAPINSSFKPHLLSPVGAPSITLYSHANDQNFVTNSNISIIEAQFLTNEYDIIIIDHTRGINQIITNSAPFRLARIITKGNLHLVGINKEMDSYPTTLDKVVTFGSPNAITNKVLTKTFPDITTLYYVNSVTEAGSVLKTGLYNQEEIDYVLMAQPLLFATLNTTDEYPTKGKLNRIIDLQEEWHNLSNLNGFPQAGIFVCNKTYDTHKEELDVFFTLYDQNIDNLINDPNLAISALNEFGDLNAQKARFGITAPILKAMQLDNDNLLGLTIGEVDIDAFNVYMGETPYPSRIYASFYK